MSKPIGSPDYLVVVFVHALSILPIQAREREDIELPIQAKRVTT